MKGEPRSPGVLRANMDHSVDIIFLNGTSSAGKTTVAKCLVDKLDGLWLHVTLNAIFDLMPRKFLSLPEWGDRIDWDTFLTGFHAVVAKLPQTGYPVILDHVCTQRRWLHQCARMFSDYALLYVGVTCPLPELRRREQQRGDRKIGIAEEHLAAYETARPFDIEVDTGANTPEECADLIVASIPKLTSPTAFDRIRADG